MILIAFLRFARSLQVQLYAKQHSQVTSTLQRLLLSQFSLITHPFQNIQIGSLTPFCLNKLIQTRPESGNKRAELIIVSEQSDEDKIERCENDQFVTINYNRFIRRNDSELRAILWKAVKIGLGLQSQLGAYQEDFLANQSRCSQHQIRSYFQHRLSRISFSDLQLRVLFLRNHSQIKIESHQYCPYRPRQLINDGQCPQFFLLDTTLSPNQCMPCSVACKDSCALQYDKCNTCTSLFKKDVGTGKCNPCPFGYAPPDCTLRCPKYCLDCSSPSKCLQCQDGSDLGTCTSTSCSTNQYFDGTNCLICPTNCIVCSATNCLICRINYQLVSGSCKQQRKYFRESSSTVANLMCMYGCLDCKVASSCSYCPFEISVPPLADGSLYCSYCPYGFWGDQKSVCHVCIANCKICHQSTKCEGCYLPYVLNAALTCQRTCTVANCKVCENPPLTGCAKCENFYQLRSDKNCYRCPANQYSIFKIEYTVDTYQTIFNMTLCSACPTNCATCDELACFSCLAGFKVVEGACQVCDSPKYYDQIQMLCVTCPSNCLTCDTQNCYACASGFIFDQTGTCLATPSACTGSQILIFTTCVTCPNGYYAGANDCVRCPEGCSLCSDAITCTGCLSMYIAQGNNCQQCTSPCKTCSSNPTTCDSCVSGYSKFGSICCQIRKYKDGFGACTPCEITCLTCTDGTNCMTCPQGSAFAAGVTPGSGVCINCKPREYQLNNLCAECHISCKTCDSTGCLICSPGFGRTLSSGLCFNCQPHQYIKDNICQECSQKCNSCINFATCTTCAHKHGFASGAGNGPDQSLCTPCSDGQFKKINTCTACHLSCLKCFTQDTCLECNTGLCFASGKFQNQGLCRSSPSGWFNQNSVCRKCDISCLTCINPTSCTTCATGHGFATGHTSNNNLCRKCSKYQISASNACSDCDSSCQKCSVANRCSSCKKGYGVSNINLLGTTTCTQCTGGTYSKTNLCEACSMECQTCLSAYSCTTCQANYGFPPQNGPDNSLCYRCQTFQFSNQNRCTRCEITCSTCINAASCTTCSPTHGFATGTTPDNALCVKCQSNQYEDTAQKLCAPCHASCLMCINGNSCTICVAGKSLGNNQKDTAICT